MRVIFLDIDGVLVRFGVRHTRVFPDFDRGCVECLNDLVDRSRAVIVVSSTWRHAHPRFLDLQWYFRDQGVRHGIHGFTDRDDCAHRAIKISRWLFGARENVEHYVILDDDDVRPHDRLVRTDPTRGLTPADVILALEILGVDNVQRVSSETGDP